MFLGIDIGTSGVKAVLLDSAGRLQAQATAPLSVSRPHDLWSEQAPDDWWSATDSGQMHAHLVPHARHAVAKGVNRAGGIGGKAFGGDEDNG